MFLCLVILFQENKRINLVHSCACAVNNETNSLEMSTKAKFESQTLFKLSQQKKTLFDELKLCRSYNKKKKLLIHPKKLK